MPTILIGGMYARQGGSFTTTVKSSPFIWLNGCMEERKRERGRERKKEKKWPQLIVQLAMAIQQLGWIKMDNISDRI